MLTVRRSALATLLALTTLGTACGGGDEPVAPPAAAAATTTSAGADLLVERLAIAEPFRRATAAELTCLVDALRKDLGEARTLAVVDTAVTDEPADRKVTEREALVAGEALVRCTDFPALYARTSGGVGLPIETCVVAAAGADGIVLLASLEFLDGSTAFRIPTRAPLIEAEGRCMPAATLRQKLTTPFPWPGVSEAERGCYADRLVADLGPGVAYRIGSRHFRSTADAAAMADTLAACADLERVVTAIVATDRELGATDEQATCIAAALTDAQRHSIVQTSMADNPVSLPEVAFLAAPSRRCAVSGPAR